MSLFLVRVRVSPNPNPNPNPNQVNMSLFLLAFVQLRRAEPHTPRPFRMPGGRVALCLAVASPLLFILANLVLLLLEPAHGAARLVFLCATVGAGSLMQAVSK